VAFEHLTDEQLQAIAGGNPVPAQDDWGTLSDADLRSISSTGMSLEQRRAKQAELDAADAPNVDPTQGMSGLKKFMAGVGSSAVNTAENVGNMVGMVSDEDVRTRNELEKPLMDTGAGSAGRMVGDVGQALAIGGGVGAAAKGLGGSAGMLTSQLAPRATALAGRAAPYAQAGLEGAVTGAMLADDPDSRKQQALAEGGLSAALSYVVPKAVQRVAKGLMKPKAAMVAADEAGEFVPLSIGAESRTARMIYNDVLPFVPGGGAISDQTGEVLLKEHDRLIQMAVPDGVNIHYKGGNADEVISELSDYWNGIDALAGAKQIPIRMDVAEDIVLDGLPVSMRGIVSKDLKKLVYQASHDGSRYGKTRPFIDGDELVELRTQYSLKASRAKTPASAKGFSDAADLIDAAIAKDLPNNGAQYLAEIPKYENYLAVSDAANAARKNSNALTTDQLVKAAADRTGTFGKATGLEKAARRTGKEFGKGIDNSNFWRRMAAYGMLAGGLSVLSGTAAPMAAMYGGAKLASSKGLQRSLVGLSAPQKALSRSLDKEGTKQAGRALRRAMAGINLGDE
jgi:hypothetical protein